MLACGSDLPPVSYSNYSLPSVPSSKRSREGLSDKSRLAAFLPTSGRMATGPPKRTNAERWRYRGDDREDNLTPGSYRSSDRAAWGPYPPRSGHARRGVHTPHVCDTPVEDHMRQRPGHATWGPYPSRSRHANKDHTGSGRVVQRGVHIPHVRDTPDVGSIPLRLSHDS